MRICLKNFFLSKSSDILKSFIFMLKKVNSLEIKMTALSDAELKNKTNIFRQNVKTSFLLIEAFAVFRETSIRVLKERLYDVQVLGAIILYKGMIAEMKTGEGKTLASSLAVYLHALKGERVHVITVNEYLAIRDSKWMGKLYAYHGLTYGCILNSMCESNKREIYNNNIVYGTNNEFAFDYLKDNLKYNKKDFIQKKLDFVIIDEIDSVLIDEARTPLVISGVDEIEVNLLNKLREVVAFIPSDGYYVDEQSRTVLLSEHVNEFIENLFKYRNIIPKESSLYDICNINTIHYFNQLLKAVKLFKKNIDYIVKNRKILIIDEFTGRIMYGKRYSEGLHQAIEAKENLPIQQESYTLASITFQNYFKMYKMISGMTATVMTEAQELFDIYQITCVQIPTNRLIKRIDDYDVIYKSSFAKNRAIVSEITKISKIGQPLLIGTSSISKSEELSSLLSNKKIIHKVLNAKIHTKEANIIAQAGCLGSVTIATNIAGRGTDIKLGGNKEMLIESINDLSTFNNKENTILELESSTRKVVFLGGLYVIGTERHESRRIDNQLRGRSGRQGDPGKTKFFISLEDNLMRIFGSAKITLLLNNIGVKNEEYIRHKWINKSIFNAQRKVETRNYEMRKSLLKFDNILNNHRHFIYNLRTRIMRVSNFIYIFKEKIITITAGIINRYKQKKICFNKLEKAKLEYELYRLYNLNISISRHLTCQSILRYIVLRLFFFLRKKQIFFGSYILNKLICKIFLVNLDCFWKEHLGSLEQLKDSINFRSYGQKSPLNEYKIESFHLLKKMFFEFEEQIIIHLFRLF